MRVLAFAALAWSAFDWPAPFLDRVGLAALGIGLLALALPSPPRSIRRPAFLSPSPSTVDLDDLDDDVDLGVVDRIGRYSGEGWVDA